jgi:hypothetical protein
MTETFDDDRDRNGEDLTAPVGASYGPIDVPDFDDSLYGSISGGLRKAALNMPTAELAGTVLTMRESNAGDRSAINSTVMVQIAAEHRTPAEIAELIAEFTGQPVAADLAQLAIDAAAARQPAQTLALLAKELSSYGLAAPAGLLLATVVRRRLPRDIAGLLTTLEVDGLSDLADKLTDEFARDDNKVVILLWLRAFNREDLALKVVRRLAKALAPDEVASFIQGLRAYRETELADATFHAALGTDLRVVANLLESLRTADPYSPGSVGAEPGVYDDGYAVGFVSEALDTLPLPDLCVLASQLSAGPWRDGAQLIWAKVVSGMTGAVLVQTLSRSMEPSGNPAGVLDGVAKAAQTHSVEDVAVLAVEIDGQIETEVDGKPRTGYDTVLDTVGATRTVPDIFAIANELTDRGYGRVAADLLGRVEAVVHQRTDGGAIAEFIDNMMLHDIRPQVGRLRRRPQSWQPENILRNVALTNDPVRLMGLIAGLTQRRRYDACRMWLEKSVVEHFDAQQLAALPMVRRRDHLPAVLQLLLRAVRTPRWTDPVQVAAIIAVIRDAGVSTPEMRRFAQFIGYTRDLDFEEITAELRRRSLAEEATWVFEGRRRRPGELNFLSGERD